MKLIPGFIAGALLCLSATAITLPASAEEVAPPAPAVDRREGNNVVWRGEVDGTIDISVRNRTLRVAVVSGRSLRREHRNHQFTGFLPARDVTVRLENVEGPGTVEVIQQPEQSNNFTAVVRVANSQPSRAEFRFKLIW